jgi:hypothetical protein
MWAFYRRVLWRTFPVLLQSFKRLDTSTYVLSVIFAAVGVASWQDYLPWWGPYAAFGAMLFLGFLQATYEESQQVAAGIALDASRLKRYESQNPDRIVFRLLPSKDYSFQVIDKRDAEGYTVRYVPYDGAYDGYHPVSRTTYTVGSLGGDFSVTLGHVAYHEPDPRDSSLPIQPYDIETYLLVWECSNGEESLVRRMAVSSEWGLRTTIGLSRWAYAVSASPRLPGLPEGEFAFEVHDRTNAPGKGMIYRNMHFVMHKLDEG